MSEVVAVLKAEDSLLVGAILSPNDKIVLQQESCSETKKMYLLWISLLKCDEKSLKGLKVDSEDENYLRQWVLRAEKYRQQTSVKNKG